MAYVNFTEEAKLNSSTRSDLEISAHKRSRLYFAMTGYKTNSIDYCREMVIRQWAQYAAWGECAREKFGNIVMINHSTPNLSRVNHLIFRGERERIPILQLKTDTLP